jgi:hypothetical protein
MKRTLHKVRHGMQDNHQVSHASCILLAPCSSRNVLGLTPTAVFALATPNALAPLIGVGDGIYNFLALMACTDWRIGAGNIFSACAHFVLALRSKLCPLASDQCS